ncbi:hypothetical protein HGM15179_002464 [Zosterops borbonicus]|uniref:Uncharacterized protein n=1 Tax=Zosterops borbonicus TaxID=364589 RepID=A0A8K1GST0_9PASS|nr:hypothetical protein HGM15179_002464 [Zosterops borbonicus]
MGLEIIIILLSGHWTDRPALPNTDHTDGVSCFSRLPTRVGQQRREFFEDSTAKEEQVEKLEARDEKARGGPQAWVLVTVAVIRAFVWFNIT